MSDQLYHNEYLIMINKKEKAHANMINLMTKTEPFYPMNPKLVFKTAKKKGGCAIVCMSTCMS